MEDSDVDHHVCDCDFKNWGKIPMLIIVSVVVQDADVDRLVPGYEQDTDVDHHVNLQHEQDTDVDHHLCGYEFPKWTNIPM